jgi:hypothetical protein
MRRKFRNRQKTGIRISLRTLLYAGAVGSVALLMLSVFVVSFFKEEESAANVNPMVVTGITVAQDTGSVYSGMRDVPVLKIKITTRGTGNRLTVSEMKFSARGTTLPLNDAIKNGRLWYTAGDPNFAMTRQYGNTIDQFEEIDFKFNARQLLQEGANYFWLAYDTGVPAGEEITIDAEMIQAIIGTLVLEPDVSAPAGSIQLKQNTPWYSTGSTDIASLESWNSNRDGSGSRPASVSKSTGTFHIQAGHSMLNRLNGCLPTIIIERNGTLINETTVTADLILVNPGGTLMNKSNATAKNKLKRLKVENGGMYVHATGNELLSEGAEFAENSTVTFLLLPQEIADNHTEFGNVVIAETNQTDLMVGYPIGRVKGNLEFRGSGPQSKIIVASGQPLQISGDLVLNNVSVDFSVKGKTQKILLGKKFYIKNGFVSDGTGKASIELGTSFILKEGSFILNHPESEIIINKSITSWHQSGTCQLPDITIMDGSVLSVKSAELGPISMHNKITVNTGATLDCFNGVIAGQGLFELKPGATIVTAHPEGISSEGSTGSIQTTHRSFSSDASYQFNGSVTPQYTGKFETKPLRGTVNKLIVDKSEITAVLILQNDIHCNGELIRKRGSINKNGYSITTGATEMAQKTATQR